MEKRSTRRRLLTWCGVGLAAGLAGCTGSDDGNGNGSDAPDSGDDDSAGETEQDAADTTGEEPITLRHNRQSGRYVFEGSTGPDEFTDTFVWDVQSLDGYDAEVEGSFEGVHGLEEFSLTASPDAPEPTMTQPYMIGVDEDLSEYVDTRFIELWLPGVIVGEADVSSFSVGDELDAGSGFDLEVVDTQTHAGIECYVLDAILMGGDVEYTYCISPEHAMVISAKNYDRGYEIELVEYEE